METLARSGDVEGAIAVGGRAMEHPMKSDIDGLRIELARATMQKDSHAEHEALRKLTARVADPELLANLGQLEVRAREFALAEGDYKKILDVEPDSAEALNLLGYVYAFQGKMADAEATFARYSKVPGQEPNSFDSLGEAYFLNGKFAEAEKAFLKAHELNAALVTGGDLRKAAYAHWLAGDLPGADKIFERYLEFRAKLKDSTVEWQHASWEYATGRQEQAIARLQKSASPQSKLQLRVWQDPMHLSADQLKQAYEATAPPADGFYRTLLRRRTAEAGPQRRGEKAGRALASAGLRGRARPSIPGVSQIHRTSPYSGFMSFSRLLNVHQKFPDRRVADIASTIEMELTSAGFGENLKPGARIAIGVGSRGIANIATIVRAVVDYWKSRGIQPFIFPAMGSHGAATAEGQADVLAHYGIHEATMGCPVLSSLDVVSLGKTPEGIEAFMDKNAFDSDGVFLIGRVKWHTDFAGKIESGLFKMMAIGLGKFAGAQRYHTYRLQARASST